jgi:CubicO group peptidase (beta-lactamase class C family)
MMRFSTAIEILLEGIAQRAFPAAAVEVGTAAGPLWRESFGTLTYDPGSAAVTDDTIFDLASLTKVIATTTLAMRAVDDGGLTLEDPVSTWLPAWRGADRADVTVRDLLLHASGLPAYLPFYRNCTGRVEFEAEICTVALEYAPRSRSIYSDLGFMLLGFILETTRAKRASDSLSGTPHVASAFDPSTALTGQFKPLASFIGADPLLFNPPRDWRSWIAPTEVDAWRGRLIVGEVHDENCWALGGAAGHAGLFGTAASTGAFARAVLRTIAGQRVLAAPSTFRDFIRRGTIPGSSRALGWDTVLATSSCGGRLSPTAIGHTGFTGTSLWIDWERDFYVVLLTNRVHPTRENERIRSIRPAFHDAVVSELQGSHLLR